MKRPFNSNRITANGRARDGGVKNEPAPWLPPAGLSPKPVPGEGQDIADQHAAEVDAAVERLGTDDPDRISEHLYLHVWIVKRHLGYTPEAAVMPRGVELVAGFLAANGPSTTKEIAAGIGRPNGSVSVVLTRSPDRFRKAGMKPTGGMPAVLWNLIGAA